MMEPLDDYKKLALQTTYVLKKKNSIIIIKKKITKEQSDPV